MPNTTQAEWIEYCKQFIKTLRPLLEQRGYELDEYQPHISGERFLTGPRGGGRKLVLVGYNTHTREKVIIKASNEALGIEELIRERRYRNVLENSAWSSEAFCLPREIAFVEQADFTISITEFIEQPQPFLERPFPEQLALVLTIFTAQENAHATRSKAAQSNPKVFEEVSSEEYEKIVQRSQDIISLVPRNSEVYDRLNRLTDKAIALFSRHRDEIDQYSGFLTHWDFTPQNFRVRDGKIYLLDHSSLHIGNKYDGFARFINFMVLYNPPLAKTLIEYISANRGPQELLALKLMRIYRLIELIRYYANWLSKTEGSVHELALVRITFWTEILERVLDDSPVPSEAIKNYTHDRDRLRSGEEKRRQQGLH